MTVNSGSLPAHVAASAPDAVREHVPRFNRTERAVHWVQAVTFLLLLLSGFALSLPQIEAILGHRALLREIHLSSAFFFAFGPSIVALAGNRRAMAQDLNAVDRWDADDVRWLLPEPIREDEPPQGRFNAGQKLNAIFVAWSTVTFSVTGFLMWQNRRFSLDVVQQANTIHTLLAYLALAAFLGHLFLATTYPATRHAFHAITQGWVERGWAEQHHPKWVQRGFTVSPAPPYDGLRTVVQLVVGLSGTAFFTRILLFQVGANTTDKVTNWIYNATSWPGVPAVHPATGVHITDWPALAWLLACVIVWLVADRTRQGLKG